MAQRTSSGTSVCVAVAYDGGAWDCFAVRAMPDRHWAVLHNRGATIDPAVRSGATEFVVGLNSFAGARKRALELADAGFADAARADRRRRHAPVLAPLAVRPPSGRDSGGDPSRVGPVVTAAARFA